MVVSPGQAKKNPGPQLPPARVSLRAPMPNHRRVLIWVLPVAALLLVGLAVFWLRGEHPEEHATPSKLAPAPVETARTPLPVPDGPRPPPPTVSRPEPVRGALHGRLITPDFRPVKGKGRVEALRGANLGIPGMGTAEVLGISAPLDGEGRFSLSNLPVIEGLVLRLEGESFAVTEAGPFLVDAGSTRDLGDLMVQPGTHVVVSVLDPRSKPVAGAKVKLFQTGFSVGFDDPTDAETITNEAGLARFEHARSALFTVRAEAEGFAIAQLQSGPLPGEEPYEFQVVVNLVEPRTLTGFVLGDAEGEPIVGAQVDAVAVDQGNASGRTTTDKEGRFEVKGLGSGDYTVAARAKGYSARSVQAKLGASAGDVELRLKKQGRLQGRVVGDDGKPVTAFDLQPRSHQHAHDPPFPRQSLMRVKNPQGEFVVENLDPGFWCFEVWAQGYALTESADVRVRQGQDISDVVIRLARGAVLKGVVLDESGAPVVDARITLHANHEPDAEFLRDTEPNASLGNGTRTDEQGRFSLSDLAARAFQIEVDHKSFAIVRRDDCVAVSGQETELDPFVLTRSGTLSGKALGSLGDPLSGVVVNLYRVGDWTHQGTTDGQGVFRFERLPPGQYELTCFGRNPSFGAILASLDGPNKPVPFSIAAGQTVRQDVVALE